MAGFEVTLHGRFWATPEGFIIGLVGVGGGIYLMAHGNNGWGFASVIGALASLVSVFIVGRKKEAKDLKKKADALAQRMDQNRPSGNFE
jgi:hypothetical protein